MKTIPIPKIRPMVDDEIKKYISEIDFGELFRNRDSWFNLPSTDIEFTNMHTEWIKSGTHNTITGLDSFNHQTIIHGCTEALTDFHWAFRKKRLRLFDKEYAYNEMSAEDFTWMHDDELREGDALIISNPFNSLGRTHPEFEKTMETCTDLNIPVLVDCCFYGMCYDVDFNFDYPCIEAACFSLSKTFALGNFRVGTLYSKNPAPSHIRSLHEWVYTPQVAAKVTMKLMEKFGPDFLVNRYKSTHLELCKEYGIAPTTTLVLGLGDQPYDPAWLPKYGKFVYEGKTMWRWGLRDVIKERYNINNPVSP